MILFSVEASVNEVKDDQDLCLAETEDDNLYIIDTTEKEINVSLSRIRKIKSALKYCFLTIQNKQKMMHRLRLI